MLLLKRIPVHDHQAGPPGSWVTFVTMTAAIKRFVLNCLFTLHKYGKQPHFFVATFDPHSLSTCMELNLPCLNATEFIMSDDVAVVDGELSTVTTDCFVVFISSLICHHVHRCI